MNLPFKGLHYYHLFICFFTVVSFFGFGWEASFDSCEASGFTGCVSITRSGTLDTIVRTLGAELRDAPGETTLAAF